MSIADCHPIDSMLKHLKEGTQLMSIYTQFVTTSQLISPVNGYTCRRITKQNIKQFGFESIDELHQQFPEFPLICSDYQSSIGKDPKGLRRKGMDRKSFYLRIDKDNQEAVERIYYDKLPKKCEKCHNYISFEMRSGRFCSRSCANGRPKSTETKKRMSAKAKEAPWGFLAKPKRKTAKTSKCIICGAEVYKRKTCSKQCYSQHRKNNASTSNPLSYYRSACAFRFNVYDYPEEFDLSLIETYGWYKAANRGNNLNGVSRDHIVSVRYGFDNNIDPSIIAHPANCQLMPHSENVKKYTDCHITVEELLERIDRWNKKYGGPSR
jgi:hypothetical protein